MSNLSLSLYIYIYVCMYVCIYIHIYIYIYKDFIVHMLKQSLVDQSTIDKLDIIYSEYAQSTY